jgi:hypothetical protein
VLRGLTTGVGSSIRLRVLIPLWGTAYFDKWFELPAASLRAPGNLYFLNKEADVELVFLTRAGDVSILESHPVFRILAREIKLKIITIDEFFPTTGTTPYGVPLSLAYAKGVQDLGDDGISTYVILLNADFVISQGSLARIFAKIKEGYHIITAPSIRVVDHIVRPILQEQLRRQGVDRCFDPRDMMSLVQRHFHQTVLTRIINQLQIVETSYYHLVYWRIDANCLAARYFLLMPLCFQVRRQIETVVCPVDYGFIEEICPGGTYAVLGDSDELLMIELQHRDSEAHFLEHSRSHDSADSVDEIVQCRVQKIIENAGQWSTREHRRSFSHTLLFHSKDLPSDLEDHLSEFDRHMSRVAAGLPPPVPLSRHFHWLGALHEYRIAMSDGGLPRYPKLIWDEANRTTIELLEIGKEAKTSTLAQWPAPLRGRTPLDKLSRAFQACSVLITLHGLVHDVVQICRGAQIFPIPLYDAHSPDLDMAFLLPPSCNFADDSALGVYLLIDSLPYWQKLKQVCDAALGQGVRVILGFRHQSWSDFVLEQHSWILSALQTFFPAEEYRAQLELLQASGQTDDGNQDASSNAYPWIPTPTLLHPTRCCGFILTLMRLAEDVGAGSSASMHARLERPGVIGSVIEPVDRT